MKVLYTWGIQIMNALLLVASWFHPKAKQLIIGRRQTLKRLNEFRDKNQKSDVFWFHCASLGEFEQARPVIELVKQRLSVKVFVTFFSPSGFEQRKNDDLPDGIAYLPSDTRRHARQFISVLKPVAAVFVKYDLWYHFIKETLNHGTKCYIISGVFRRDQMYFRWYGRFYLPLLREFKHVFLQNRESLPILQSHEIHRISWVGDSRFDRVWKETKKVEGLHEILEFKGSSKLIIAGSSWPPEEKLLMRYFEENQEDIKLILVPHDVSANRLHQIERLFSQFEIIRFSTWDKRPTNGRILLVDSIGVLSKLYRYADLSVIGGGFGRGLHNILETLCWGTPAIFGPKTHKFWEAEAAIQTGAAFEVNDYQSFKKTVSKLLKDEKSLNQASRYAKAFVEGNLGSSEKMVDSLLGDYRP